MKLPFSFKKDKSLHLSMDAHQVVRGYKIVRLPLGAFLSAIGKLKDMPGNLLALCFPGMGAGEILEQMRKFDADMLTQILSNALLEAPAYVVKIFAEMAELPEEELLNDPAVGLDGIMEMIRVWMELNGIENFIKAAKALVGSWKAAGKSQTRNTGFKD